MDKGKKIITKPCFVAVEQMTPQKQLALSAELKKVINERNMLTTRTRMKVLSALDEISGNTSEHTKKKLKNKALHEILESEMTYLKQLELMINYFMEPIQEKGFLDEDDFRTVFGSIKTIYNVNGELLNELKADVTNVAQAFENMAPYFKLYSIYAYGYKTSNSVLQRSRKNNPEFIKFVESQETRPEVKTKLTSLLIVPIQRIPRYRLLLKQVLDYSSSTEPDYPVLVASLRKIEEVAKHVDGLLEDQENSERMLNLQQRLINQKPSLIKPGRKIIKEGVLHKLSQKGTHSYKRYFVLMNDIFIYCKMKNSNPDMPNSLKCSSIFPLNKCKITEVVSKGCFKVHCQEEEVILYHESVCAGQEWVNALKDSLKKYIENRQTLRKDSSARRPAKRKNLFEYEESGVSPGKPRKKRIIDREEYEDVHKIISNDSEDSDVERKPFFKCMKRKSIKDISSNVVKDSKDSLFPLRTESLHNNLPINTKETEQANWNADVEVTNKEVFVFGSNRNGNRGFSFSMGNFFRGIGNSMRNMFGFK